MKRIHLTEYQFKYMLAAIWGFSIGVLVTKVFEVFS
jgi:hypothetical protein